MHETLKCDMIHRKVAIYTIQIATMLQAHWPPNSIFACNINDKSIHVRFNIRKVWNQLTRNHSSGLTFVHSYASLRTMSNILISSALITLLCMLPKSTLPLYNRHSAASSVSKQSHAERFIKSVAYPEYFQEAQFATQESVVHYHSRNRRDAEQQPNRTSLVFVFDASATNGPNFVQLRKGTELIFNELSRRANTPIYNYIFVPFTEMYGERG